jgi:hypothetical protein
MLGGWYPCHHIGEYVRKVYYLSRMSYLDCKVPSKFIGLYLLPFFYIHMPIFVCLAQLVQENLYLFLA